VGRREKPRWGSQILAAAAFRGRLRAPPPKTDLVIAKPETSLTGKRGPPKRRLQPGLAAPRP